MNTGTNSDHRDPALDAQLARLPTFDPPHDFAARLAAAAARQAGRSTPAARPTFSGLLPQLPDLVPTLVGSGLLALALALTPWAAVAGHAAFPWVIAGSAAVAGLWMTRRLLARP